MLKSFTFWLKTAIVFQLITGLVHSLSFLSSPQPSSEEEKQMLDLMISIKNDLGAGFNPSMMDIFLALSSCFSFLYLLGGLINIHLLRIKLPGTAFKGIINISILIFGACFVVMSMLTFLPPIILTGLTFVSLVAARLTIKPTA